MGKHFAKGTIVATVGVAALVFGGPTLAGAASANNPKASILAGDASCGFQQSGTVIGFTNFHRSGDVVSIEYHLKSGIPNSTYFVELWGDTCSFFGAVATVTTNGAGVANGNGDITVPSSSTRFFASSFNVTSGFNDTPAVTLAP